MNILFFLKPKAELDLVYEDDTVEMAMERIEDHQFSSISGFFCTDFVEVIPKNIPFFFTLSLKKDRLHFEYCKFDF